MVGGHLGEVSHPVIILQPEQKRNENSFVLCLLKLLLVYIAINNCDLQVAITTNKWQPQLTVFVARSDFAINKLRWLGLTANQVSVAQIVSADACVQGAQGSNPADD